MLILTPLHALMLLVLNFEYFQLLTLMRDIIPVSFIDNGTQYSGYFTGGKGASVNEWQLYLNGNYYKGTLRLLESRGWVFDSPKNQFQDLSDFFQQIVIAWYE